MKKRAIHLVSVLAITSAAFYGCKTTGQRKNSSEAFAEPKGEASLKTLVAVGYGLDRGDVVAYGDCAPADGSSPQKVEDNAQTTSSSCNELKRMASSEFRTKFGTAYAHFLNRPMNAYEKGVLALVGTANETDQRKLHRYAKIYGNVLDQVFALSKPATLEVPAKKLKTEKSGLSLAQGDQEDVIIDVNMQTPFGSPTNSPNTFLGLREADRIRVEVDQADPNCRQVRPLMVYVGNNTAPGPLKRASSNFDVYEFESNFPGRRLRYTNLMFQVSQQQWSSVVCRYKVTEILYGTGGGGNTGGSGCAMEFAAICPQGQIDQCIAEPNNPSASHRCIADISGPAIDPFVGGPGVGPDIGPGGPGGGGGGPDTGGPLVGGGGGPDNPGQGCSLSFNQQTFIQPSFDWHGGNGTIDYSINGACIGELYVDWPGCSQARITRITVRDTQGTPIDIFLNGQTKGVFRLPYNIRARSVDVSMTDDRDFRFVGCTVDLLVR